MNVLAMLKEPQDQHLYTVSDFLGSIRMIYNFSEELQKTYKYDVWGNIIEETGTLVMGMGSLIEVSRISVNYIDLLINIGE